MNTLFNSALRQSASIRKDLEVFADAPAASPALLGQISASLTSFSRTVDDYSRLAKQEIVAAKQDKAFERVKTFRSELSDYRDQFNRLKQDNEAKQTTLERTELFGRRPHNTATPENPYSNNANAQHSPWRPANAPPPEANPYHATREGHALRESSFMSQTNAQLDEFLDRGRAVLGDLGTQREMLKGTQKRLYGVANTLGISNDTIRMVERRAKQDKWIFYAGVVIFFVFCYFVLRWLR
ncbi:V-snare-domain-containing protein [Pseudovirgaria hyperparasitica]|uniref:Protein transport protein BOS1 n=1 Tax=Pseudovirgaria hyperparasitica TaxID=470096 RepID=A0A6A6WCN1_9PEZI|nr:V-snare-domain-containing protein [Pseudovirgaria hyperparasitica]KAF2760592.1 V-snare-domain-containing protein [Pseudovirgaria hyperparasitica]